MPDEGDKTGTRAAKADAGKNGTGAGAEDGAGTGTTSVAALHADRNSIGVEIDPEYMGQAERRIGGEVDQMRLFGVTPELLVTR